MKYTEAEIKDVFDQYDEIRSYIDDKLRKAGYRDIDYTSLEIEGDYVTFQNFDFDGYGDTHVQMLPLELVLTATAEEIKETVKREAREAREEKERTFREEQKRAIERQREEDLKAARTLLREAGEL